MEQEVYWIIEKAELSSTGKPLWPWTQPLQRPYSEPLARSIIAELRERETSIRRNNPQLRKTAYRMVKITREVVEEG